MFHNRRGMIHHDPQFWRAMMNHVPTFCSLDFTNADLCGLEMFLKGGVFVKLARKSQFLLRKD